MKLKHKKHAMEIIIVLCVFNGARGPWCVHKAEAITQGIKHAKVVMFLNKKQREI